MALYLGSEKLGVTIARGGVTLPTLINEGSAADLLSDKQLIDSEGNAITGTIQSIDAQTITPTTSDQVISAGVYISGDQTIQGDANLVASNIRSGVSIFGVAGSCPEATIEYDSSTKTLTITTSEG